MFSTFAHAGVAILCGLIVAAGVIGVIIPVIPGLLLTWSGVLLWTFIGGGGPSRWVFLAVATVVAVVGAAIKYTLPGRRLKQSGVRGLSILAGAVLGLIGFFVIPFIGLPIGFIVGVLIAETLHQRDMQTSGSATMAAVKALGLAMVIEIMTAFSVAVVWVLAVFLA